MLTTNSRSDAFHTLPAASDIETIKRLVRGRGCGNAPDRLLPMTRTAQMSVACAKMDSRPRSVESIRGKMSALAQSHALSRLLEEHAAWRLLRAGNAPIIAALLGAHLGGEQRRIESEELY